MRDDPTPIDGTRACVMRAQLKTPRAAAIAGILFSILIMSAFWLLRLSFPADPRETGAWRETSSERVSMALNLVPFAGIAFMWLSLVMWR